KRGTLRLGPRISSRRSEADSCQVGWNDSFLPFRFARVSSASNRIVHHGEAIASALQTCNSGLMLTPAEELGLSGLSLVSRVRKAFYHIPEARLIGMIDDIRAEALRRHLIYLRDGETETIRVLPCPVTVLPDQLAYIHYVSLTIQNALKRLPELY